MGRNISLGGKFSIGQTHRNTGQSLPEQCENSTNNHRQYIYTPVFSLLVDLDQAVQKRRKPQKPFEKSRQHNRANNSRIHDLSVCQGESKMSFVLGKLTSFTGHGAWS
jgi:hypothetical protein